MAKKFFSNGWIKSIIILAVVLGIGFSAYKMINKTDAASGEAVSTVKEETVRIGDIIIGITGDGTAEIPIVNLNFELSGKLKELYVNAGDVIEEGQILAKLEDTEYQNKLQTAEISYKKSLISMEQNIENTNLNLINEKQKLDELIINLKETETQYQNMVELEDVYARQDIENGRTAYESVKKAYEVQLERYNTLSNSSKDIELEELNVESARISLDMAKNDLENTVLYSPLTATVLNIAYKPGETVTPGNSSSEATADTTNFMVVTDSDKVEVVVPVSEIDLGKVQVGQSAEVTFEAYSGQIFNGTVISIGALPRVEQSGLVSYDVRIALENGENIKTGMTCEVSFIMRQTKNVIIISNKAVSIEDGKQVVRVKDEKGEVHTKIIKTGLTDGKNVEVTEGLNIEETVLIGEKK